VKNLTWLNTIFIVLFVKPIFKEEANIVKLVTGSVCYSILRCISHFDHHCKWLNNCVGDKNYRLFFCLICFVAVTTIVFIAVDLDVMINKKENNNNNNEIEKSIISLIELLSLILSAGIFAMDVYLIIFHIYLKFRNMTTFEFIIKHRNQVLISLIQKEKLNQTDH
jgi:palmitoyltransferase